MAANLTIHLPIIAVQTVSGNTPQTDSKPELSGQTFPFGVPVQLTAAGYVQVWDGATVAAGILGISEGPGSNLASSGLGAPVPPFGSITGTGSTLTYGSVPNQPGAINIPLGAPISDGRTLYNEANGDTIFLGQFDNSAGAVAADYTPTIADVGKNYGMTKSTGDNSWYIDKSKTGGAAVVQIVGLDGIGGATLNAQVKFQFLVAASQIP